MSMVKVGHRALVTLLEMFAALLCVDVDVHMQLRVTRPDKYMLIPLVWEGLNLSSYYSAVQHATTAQKSNLNHSCWFVSNGEKLTVGFGMPL